LKKTIENTSIGSSFRDMYNSSRAMYTSLAMGLVYCLVYIYLMSFFAECISWIIVVCVQIGGIASTYALFNYHKLRKE